MSDAHAGAHRALRRHLDRARRAVVGRVEAVGSGSGGSSGGSIRARIRQLPRVAALGFGGILALTLALGVTSRRELGRLERELYPALELTRTLDEQLEQVQAALQDAAEAGDRERLTVADQRYAAIQGVLRGARVVAAGDSLALATLDRQVQAYYTSARAGAHYLADASGPASAALGTAAPQALVERMVRDHQRLRRMLDQRAAAQRVLIDAAFARLRVVQTTMWAAIAIAPAAALAVLAVLAYRLARDLVRPLTAAVTAVTRLAEGDVTVRIPDGRDDEMGRMLTALRGMVGYLDEMSTMADAIAAGDVAVVMTPRSPRDRFGSAFADMAAYLQSTAAAAERLAQGDLTLTIAPRSARDAFGRSLGATLDRLSTTIRELRDREARLRAAEEETRTREARFRALVQESSDVIVVLDRERRVTYASPAIVRVLGVEPAELEGYSMGGRIHPDDMSAVAATLQHVVREAGARGRTQCRMRHTDGTWRDVECVAVNLLHEPAIGGVVVNARDVTERSALEAQLTHQAFHDPLTGLANRTLFRDRVEQALRRRERGDGRSVSVLFLDLDNFKTVNDSLGHHAGDVLLQEVATRLLHATRGCDTVARLGGDEFAVLIESVRDQADTLVVVERVTSAIARPTTIAGREVVTGGSVGVASALPEDTADVLLRNADVALYAAKAAGKGRYRCFEPTMLDAAMDRMELESDLARALDQGDFYLVYQPIVALDGGETVGAEALVRWQHPTRGAVAPARFVPIAEATGQIVALGGWVLREACREAASWPPRADGAPRTVTVNVSGRQLAEPSLAEDVRAVLAETGLAPERLTLEITGSVVMQDTERNLAQLHALKALGVRLAIDDFGTGYSSLAYLQRFPVDVLKIDKRFVDGIPGGGNDAALASIIVTLGRMLALRTVAEGVEDEEQRSLLQSIGCDYAQGYLFARPLAAHELRRQFAQRTVADGGVLAQAAPPI